MLHGHEARLLPLLARRRRATTPSTRSPALQIVRRALRALETRMRHRRQPGIYLDVVGGLYPLLVRELAPLDERLRGAAPAG